MIPKKSSVTYSDVKISLLSYVKVIKVCEGHHRLSRSNFST